MVDSGLASFRFGPYPSPIPMLSRLVWGLAPPQPVTRSWPNDVFGDSWFSVLGTFGAIHGFAASITSQVVAMLGVCWKYMEMKELCPGGTRSPTKTLKPHARAARDPFQRPVWEDTQTRRTASDKSEHPGSGHGAG